MYNVNEQEAFCTEWKLFASAGTADWILMDFIYIFAE